MKYLLLSLLWGLTLYFLSTGLSENKLWFTLIAVLMVGTPIALAGIYRSTIKQIRRLEIFAHRGLLYRLLSGRPLKIIAWIAWALPAGFLMLLQFQFYSPAEWILFSLVVPAFWIVYSLCRRLMLAELKPYLLTNESLSWSCKITPLIMTFLYLVYLALFGENTSYDSLDQAIQLSRAQLDNSTSSAVTIEASNYFSLFEGLKAYALGRIGSLDNLSALLLVGIGSYIVFFNAAVMLSSFLISGTEYRRIFTPPGSADIPEAPSRAALSMTVAVATFLTLFIFLPLVVYLEAWLQQNPRIGVQSQQAQTQIVTRLERIDDRFFSDGTLAQLEQARIEALRNVDASLALFTEQADLAFAQMESNVDIYLDWYYSLTAEYARIGKLMVGDLEEFMVQNLQETLMQGEVFGEVERAFNEALSGHEEAQEMYQQRARDIMATNRVEPAADQTVEVSRLATLSEILSPPVHQDMIDFEQRLGLSGGGAAAGAVSAVVISKIIAKVVGKNTLKLAATGASKVIASKAIGSGAGAGAGAVAGATIGSVVPGLGTAVGAVVGGVIGGIAVGISIDKVLIEIEELVNREAFKQEIIAAIRESKEEFMASL